MKNADWFVTVWFNQFDIDQEGNNDFIYWSEEVWFKFLSLKCQGDSVMFKLGF